METVDVIFSTFTHNLPAAMKIIDQTNEPFPV